MRNYEYKGANILLRTVRYIHVPLFAPTWVKATIARLRH